MFKVLCSLTNPFSVNASGVNGLTSDSKELSTAEAETQRNTKYFSELKTLYILGKHYPQPICEYLHISVLFKCHSEVVLF